MPATPKTVLVLMGGYSTEHDISVKSGTGVVRQLDPELYRPWPVVLTKDRRWRFSPKPLSRQEQIAFDGEKHDIQTGDASDGWEWADYPALERLRTAHGAFIALHGEYGEDGRIQSLLEFYGIPYTGSGVLGSASGMDKARTKEVLSVHQLPLAPSVELSTEMGAEALAKAAYEWGSLPLVLKVPTGGSSIGVGIARTREDLSRICADLCQQGHRILCEKFVSGREFTCGVLDGAPALPPTEIRPHCGEFFDFESKYKDGGSDEITPADLPPETTGKLQELARKVHESLRLRAYSRTDFILGPDGPIILEVNTLPGLTEASLIPKECAAIGISYRDMLTIILRQSWDS